MSLSKEIQKLRSEIVNIQIRLERFKPYAVDNLIWALIRSKEVIQLKSKLEEKQSQLQTLDSVYSSLKETQVIMTTPTCLNPSETNLRKLGFYLTRRQILPDGKFTHTYNLD